LLNERARPREALRNAIEAALERMYADVERMRVGPYTANIHRELRALVDRYADAMRRYLDAVKGSDTSAVRQAALDLEAVQDELIRWRRA